MLEELSKTVKAQLYERVSSPLLGSFLIAWCGWNYKFVLVLISSMEAEKKIAYINANLYPSMWDRVLEGFTYPLLTSLALIFAYPWPARWIFSYSRKQQIMLKKLQQVLDEETPLTKEDAKDLRRENSKISSEYEEEISSWKKRVSMLSDQLVEANKALQEKGGDKEVIGQLISDKAYLEQVEQMLNMRIKSQDEEIHMLRGMLSSMKDAAMADVDRVSKRQSDRLERMRQALSKHAEIKESDN